MRYLLATVFLLTMFKYGFSQKTPLETPYIYGVSYDSIDKKYHISWTENNYDSIKFFRIVILNNNINNVGGGDKEYYGDTILKNSDYVAYDYAIPSEVSIKGGTFYKTYNLEKDTLYFGVQAFPYNNSKYTYSNLSQWTIGNAPCNIVLKSDFDTCYYKLHIMWNKYQGWGSDAMQYSFITCRDEEGNISEIKTKTRQINDLDIYLDTSINIPDVKKKDQIAQNYKLSLNKKYFFQISVKNSSGDESLSNVLVVDTHLPQRPDFMDTYGTTISPDNNSIEVRYFVGSTYYHNYNVLRSDVYNGTFETVGSTSETSSGEKIVKYIDNINALEKPYYYKVQLLNNCTSNSVVLKESEVESSVILKAKPIRNDVELSWTKFEGFKSFHYTLYKVIDGNETSEIIDSSKTSITVSLNLIPEQGKDIAVRFWINAVDDSDSRGSATSNTVIFPIANKIVVQEYFTPNGDGKNDVFRPVTITTYEFKLIIYNRWGMKVFETSDSGEGWNGRYNGTGAAAPQGGYMYYFKVKLAAGDAPMEQRGSFLLMLP